MATASRLTITLLGGFQIRLEPDLLLNLPTRKAQALLAYLAMPAGQPRSREELGALLWGGRSDDSARNSLRQAIFGLRRAFSAAAPTILIFEGATVGLNGFAVDVDVAAFERDAADGTPAALQHAVGLYRGDLLAGLAVPEPPFEEWLRTERERLRELALQSLVRLLNYYHATSATELAIQTALRLLSIDPLQEAVYRTLMELYVHSGRRGSALRQYQHCVNILHRELGVEPEAETKALYQEILRSPVRRQSSATVTMPDPLVADTVLVGRDAELAVLYEALGQAMARHGRVVSVLGEAGIGKTRLMAELASEASRRGAGLLVGRGYESEQPLPLGPWADALRGARLTEDVALFESLGPSRRAHLGRVLPDVNAGAAGIGDSDYRPIFESVLELVRLLAAKRPLVVIIEDLHWADQMTVRLAAFLGHRLQAFPVMLVLTAREDELCDAPHLAGTLNELAREPHAGRLVLPPLTKPNTETLVRMLSSTAADTTVTDLAEQVWIVSEGNPFVVMEAMRAVERHPSAATLALPERVREMVERRLERLSEPSQHLLATAAVIGRDFEFALLQRASGLTAAEAAESVEELVRRRVVQGVGECLDFVHSRIRETVLARLLPHRQAMLHRAVADAIEELYTVALEPHDVALGTHYQHAGVWDRAMLYLGRAGMRALSGGGAWHEAATLLRAALGALDHLPDGKDTAQLRADLLFAIAVTCYHVGDIEAMLNTLRSVESIAAQIGDERRLMNALQGSVYCLSGLGDLPGAIQAVDRARAIVVKAGTPAGRVVYQAAQVYYAAGDYGRAVDAARAEMDVLQGRHLYLRRWGLLFSVIARAWVMVSLAELGRFPEGLRVAEEAFALAEATQNTTDLILACIGAGRLGLIQGDFPSAIEVLARALPFCETGGDCFIYRSRVASGLGLAYLLADSPEEGLALLHSAVATDTSLRYVYSLPLSLSSLAEGYLLRGAADEAERYGAQALEASRTYGFRGWEAWTLRLHGDIAQRRGESSAALGYYQNAMVLATELGMRPLLAHCHRGVAGVVGEDRVPIAEHSATAARMYREMNMTYWLNALDRQSAAARPAREARRRRITRTT